MTAIALKVYTREPVVGTHVVKGAAAVRVAVYCVATTGGKLEICSGDATGKGAGVVDQAICVSGSVVVCRAAISMAVGTGKDFANLRVN